MTTAISPPSAMPAPRGLFGMVVSPEWELLLTTASAGEQSPRLRNLINQPLDWVLFERLAETHGLLPIAAARLGADPSLLPAPVVQELRTICQENARRSLWFAGELFSVLGTLNAANVEAVPFKGPTLAAMAQGDLILRQFCDLDIMVRPRDWPRAKKALLDAGFTEKHHLTSREEKAYVASACDFTFHHGPVRNVLEIHWDFVPHFFAIRIPLRQLMARATTVELCGRPVPTLAPRTFFSVSLSTAPSTPGRGSAGSATLLISSSAPTSTRTPSAAVPNVGTSPESSRSRSTWLSGRWVPNSPSRSKPGSRRIARPADSPRSWCVISSITTKFAPNPAPISNASRARENTRQTASKCGLC